MYIYIYIYIYKYICIYRYISVRPYESCKNIEGLVPPRCSLGAGTSVVKNISARTLWSGGNEKANSVAYSQFPGK